MTTLTQEQIRRRQDLTEKLSMRTLSRPEADELKTLLEMERAQATTLGDLVGIIAVGLLLGLLLDYILRDR